MLPGRSKQNCKTQWLKTQYTKVNKSSWPEQEDEQLREIVQKYGTKHWSKIANEFNELEHEQIRTRKQCRDHWLNYLNPEISK